MPVKTVRFYTFALVVLDILAVLSAFTLAYILRVQLDPRPLVNQISAYSFFVTFAQLIPFWILTLWGLGLYNPNVYRKRLSEIGKLLLASFIGVLLLIGYAYVVDQAIFPARLVPLYAGIATFILLVIGREVLRIVRDVLFWFGFGIQRVLVIGSGDTTKDMISQLSNTRHSGYNVVAVVGTSPKDFKGTTYASLTTGLSSLKTLAIDTIIQTELYEDAERNRVIMAAAQDEHITYCFIPGEAEFYSGKNQVDVFLSYPIITVYQTPLTGWGEVVKRIFDLTLVIITLPIWGALFLLTALLQMIFNPGPLFYKSARLTRFSKPFGLYKFRSMGREDLAVIYERDRKVARDPRITRFGKFLRITSLDELPQLLNVLRGDISLVGPRPILPQELGRYKGRGSLLHSVKSGLTGLWQVSGRNDLAFDKRVELELYYAQNWSFWLDLKILFKTIGVVFGRGGAK